MPNDISDEDLKTELIIMMRASGKTKEQCIPQVEMILKKASDPMVRKGLVKNINDSRGVKSSTKAP